MADVLEKLEERIRQLLARLDNLEAENRSFRALVADGAENLTQQEVLDRIAKLKQEKEKLEKKIELLDQKIGNIVGEMNKLAL
jgi:prefoldin subunit 5